MLWKSLLVLLEECYLEAFIVLCVKIHTHGKYVRNVKLGLYAHEKCNRKTYII